ncbi:glycosyltransferase, partial [Acidimicrobiia bacterium]|nr:glycosyltransferase [Acidimicrobiia bacterium]
MSDKKVSVIMSAYNAEKSIEKTISSLLMQTYKNLEIIIADDGSTDRTYELLENFSQNNKNISLIKNSENLGLTKSLNILLGLAKGYYIARQDADDYSNANRISNQVRFITKHKLDAV